MDRLSATPRNRFVGGLADLLKEGKAYANKTSFPQSFPLVGGMGLGDLFMGEAPSLVDDISYGGLGAIVRGGNRATGGLGTYTLDKRTADLGLLGADAYGIGKLATLGSARAGNRLLSGVYNPNRREMMKKTAALSGAGLAAAAIPATVRAVRAVGKGTDNAAVQTAKKYKYNTLDEYMDDVMTRAQDEGNIRTSEMGFSGKEADEYSTEFAERFRHSLMKQDANDYLDAKRAFHDSRGIYGKEKVNEFSPKVKEQMKQYKKDAEIRGADWRNFWWEGQ